MPVRSPRACPDIRTLRPMLATSAGAVQEDRLHDPHWVYELKYDGIRALIEITAPRRRRSGGASASKPAVRIFSRLGNDKTTQFPGLVEALTRFAARLTASTILDGEIVALDGADRPTTFQRLQNRLQGTPARGGRTPAHSSTAFIAFDVLCLEGRDLCEQPLVDRRRALEQLFRSAADRRTRARLSGTLRLSELEAGDGRPLLAAARQQGLEGLIAKHATSRYRPGRRTRDWRKVKIVRQQEFVVGGWTEPRGSRSHFGALLLGYYQDSVLRYAGRVGSGFGEAELAHLWARLRPLASRRCPFDEPPRPPEPPHWVKPTLVAQVKFTEWTDDGRLRHPTYLGLREDRKPRTVRREPGGVVVAPTPHHATPGGHAGSAGSRRPRAGWQPGAPRPRPPALDRLCVELTRIEDGGGDGTVTLPSGDRLAVTNLGKAFWPKLRLTKGDLLRYYVTVSPYLLPVVQDRPLVMKRFPNGIDGKSFYQQRAPDTLPDGVRVEPVEGDDEVPARLIGGSLLTLLHMAQLAVISQDPWFSRVQSPHEPDQAAIDLDPGPGVSFSQVLDVARWVRDELAALDIPSCPKTSGSSGLHIFVPLEPGTPYEAGMIFCQIVGTVVAAKHGARATVERRRQARAHGTVYIDCLQNIEGKTLACAYSARASPFAGASTPLTWEEVDEGIDHRDFTLRTLPARLAEVGDLWTELRESPGADLRAVERYTKG